ncbi:FAD assembly factor SdhE [Zophobihabitans entericus]|uniref:FAD assembly factor SdhE n=1 Tax=Zophobihabitans entericus TaxID=1635327 RepID=A0A6G9ID99_9GAMM|nr:succinate dehydrogenase assembly factor 2 [Zophobihabitans entericus]QIQ21560.1 succinate dehydrogenase assembly factor 2 [Zophobihabitans entericus]
MNQNIFSQVLWSCRRGMRELDLMLIPFAENCFNHLSPEQQQAFQLLLKQDDLVLFDSFFNNQPLQVKVQQELVELIKSYQQCGKLN